MTKVILIIILVIGTIYICEAKQIKEKPKVIVMTDGEIDDHSSMVRFLLYTCDIELLAIIETNSVFQRNGHSDEPWFEKQLDYYEQVYPNLIIHNPDYPSADKIRTFEYDRAIAKVVMYNIWYQNGAGNYIKKYHPKVRMLFCGSFSGTWNYDSQTTTYSFIKKEVINNHGLLGTLYPQKYVSEGDSPAFLDSIANGLRNHEDPTYGGWGSRFSKLDGFNNVFVDALDDNDKRKSLRRWIKDANLDFQARMDYCVSSKYEDANHSPVVQLKGKKDITVKSGNKVKLDAGKSSDPDCDAITFAWWQYTDAGSYKGLVEINSNGLSKADFITPKVNKPETIHIILKLKDNGSPALRAYQRLIVTVVP